MLNKHGKTRACLQTPAAEMTPSPAYVKGQPRREGIGCAGPRGLHQPPDRSPTTSAAYRKTPELYPLDLTRTSLKRELPCFRLPLTQSMYGRKRCGS